MVGERLIGRLVVDWLTLGWLVGGGHPQCPRLSWSELARPPLGLFISGGGGGSDWTGTAPCGDEAAARASKSKSEPDVGISES